MRHYDFIGASIILDISNVSELNKEKFDGIELIPLEDGKHGCEFDVIGDKIDARIFEKWRKLGKEQMIKDEYTEEDIKIAEGKPIGFDFHNLPKGAKIILTKD